MKYFTRILAVVVFSSLMIFISCKKGGGSDPDPLDEQAAKLIGATWIAGEAQIKKNNLSEGIGDWANFSMTFQYNNEEDLGQYTVNNVPDNSGAADVWGIDEGATSGSGSWTFENLTNTSVIVREDGIRMNVSIVENTSLSLTFNIPSSGGRVAGFDGDWEFILSPQ